MLALPPAVLCPAHRDKRQAAAGEKEKSLPFLFLRLVRNEKKTKLSGASNPTTQSSPLSIVSAHTAPVMPRYHCRLLYQPQPPPPPPPTNPTPTPNLSHVRRRHPGSVVDFIVVLPLSSSSSSSPLSSSPPPLLFSLPPLSPPLPLSFLSLCPPAR